MVQASQTPVIWTVVIATIILLVAGIFAYNAIPTAEEVANSIDIPTSAEVEAMITNAINKIEIPETSTIDTEKIDRVCELTEGCDGQWDLNNFMRQLAVGVVIDELTERDNKKLFNGIENIVDVEEREDINNVLLHDNNGEMTVNQEDYDSLYDANDDTIVTVEFVIEVEYFDDDDNEDRTKYFKVTATISDVEDGIAEGDVVINSIERVSEHFEFD